MSFLNPALLGGLLFFLVPIIIYLIFQRKIKEMDWAAM
ncbi:MAG: BatA domain-containing protein, partial [Planctomycetes bacterium]|nr:BatA domain-containing protein [Planctomycetota bacterium]